MLREYIPLVFLVGLVVLTALGIILVSHFVPGARPTPVKLTPYESGMPPLGGTRSRFSVKFYLVAVLFIVFDIETVFMIPWGVGFRELGLFGLVEMAIFVAVVMVALMYVWMRGALEWN